ncbi:MAG TPA: AarF/ABC1/UbiB kinase family protein, partial [Microthrixaceae bacterium]|nr:AarF/ABC1/UbiB kinase family protein [Microthrixaceae bacterium]
QEQLVGELQRIIKALLGMGARLPKILMLYVKNLVFLDGAIERLAPDLDLIGEIASLSGYLSATHGERLAAEVGADASDFVMDAADIRRNVGIDESNGNELTYRELQERRMLIRRRLNSRGESRPTN